MSWNKKLEKVRPAIDPMVLQRLTAANITDMAALQERFFGDPGSSLRLGGQTLNVAEDKIAALLAKSLVSSSESLTTSWIGKYWSDSVLVLAFLYVLLALGRPWFGTLISSRVPELPKLAPQVVAGRTIPVYGMIRDDNLRVRNATEGTRVEQLTSRFAGRYALTAIAAGTAITADKLSSKHYDLAGLSVLHLEIKRTGPLDGRQFPEDVDLLFSARQDSAAGTSLPARLLALDTKVTPPLATVALAKDKADEAARWIGSSDVYLSWRVR
jgi:hypothetical protein